MSGVNRLATVSGAVVLAGLALGASPGRAQSLEDLKHMSIAELANIDVSSVSKTPEGLNQAPASIFVITHDDIVRSGAQSMPEILRLAPNLQVYQTSSSQFVVTARGFNGSAAAQNFSNKLLVLIDGRTVYSPLYSGVYWDIQDVPPDDIDRIEVISGPGATLWGANAVNGVINIVTRDAGQTQGGDLNAYAGNQNGGGSVRYGGKVGEALTYRIYAMAMNNADTRTLAGAKIADGWSKPQLGFRVDWAGDAADKVTVQGDGYNGVEDPGSGFITGANVLGRWTRDLGRGSTLQIQTYYDHTRRGSSSGGFFNLDTYDLELQHNFAWAGNAIVWGAGVRSSRYDILGKGGLTFAPSARSLRLGNLFAQDTLSLPLNVKLTAGLKLESDPYIGVTPLPDLRLTWTPSSTVMLWTATSYAIRAPTPFDRDVVEKIGPTVFLAGAPNFQREKLSAYEFGGRFEPISRLSLSVSAYYNVYDDLRSIEPKRGGFLPLAWGNGMRGKVWGVESWADFQAASWWRLSASINFMREEFRFAPGASGLLGVVQAGDDPQHLASLKSSMNLGRDVTLDADLRYVDALPNPAVPAYVELGGRIGWNITDKIQLSLAGQNLLHDRHQEYPAPGASASPRQVYAALRLKF